MRHVVSQKRRIVVLGASGATGQLVVSTALERGHDVTAVVRRPGAFEPRELLHEAMWTDLGDVRALSEVIAGTDVVISALGGAAKGPTTVCTEGMRSAVTAMGQVGVKRLLAVSAHGVAETHDQSLYSLAVWAGVAGRMRDKESMESVITRSQLAWTLVRPPSLRNRPPTGHYRVGTDLRIRLWSSIGRADLAAFLVTEVEEPRFIHAFPRVSQ